MIFKKEENIKSLLKENKFTVDGKPFVCLINNLYYFDTRYVVEIVEGYRAAEKTFIYNYLEIQTFGFQKYYLKYNSSLLAFIMLQKI